MKQSPKTELDYKKMAQEFEKAWREEQDKRRYYQEIVEGYRRSLRAILGDI